MKSIVKIRAIVRRLANERARVVFILPPYWLR